VTLAYSAAGAGDTALLFIHGGFADRSFFDAQLRAFAERYRVVAVDLAGHGESARNRTAWSVARFADDVRAVADAEQLRRIVLFGNSLGGPVAIEAALLLTGRAIGVVGIEVPERGARLARRDEREYRRRNRCEPSSTISTGPRRDAADARTDRAQGDVPGKGRRRAGGGGGPERQAVQAGR
jgi:pimeloyl-ACP methyl ester carboxylesterase